MNILFISSEAAPFAKTGGLADVSGVMPRALAGSEAVLEFVRRNDLRFDIVHCNDWQTAMIPMYGSGSSRNICSYTKRP